MDFEEITNDKETSSDDQNEARKLVKKGKKRGRKPKSELSLLEKKSFLTQFIEDNAEFCKSYRSQQYQNETFEIKRFIHILNNDEPEQPFVGEIVDLKVVIKDGTHLPVAYVRWYYSKYHLSQKQSSYEAVFSERELFRCVNHFEHIPLDFLQGYCKVMSFSDFDKLDRIETKTYFTRADYNPEFGTLSPSVETWPKQCICKKAMNPDYHYIFCDGCRLWFHLLCVDITKEVADNMGDFFCPECKNKLVRNGSNVQE